MISRIALILFLLFVINGLVIKSQIIATNSTSESPETTQPSSQTTQPSSQTTQPSSQTTQPSSQTTITVTATPLTSTNGTIITSVTVITTPTTTTSNSTTNGSTPLTTESSTNPTSSQSTNPPTSQSTNPATNETTTPIPTTLPTLPPPTLPPSPEAPTNIWNVSYSEINGTICTLAEFSLTLRIEYNSTVKDAHYVTGFNIPSDSSVDTNNSYCNNITQVLSLNFNIVNETMGSITFTFNQTNGNVFAEKIKLIYQLTENLFPNYINKKDYGKMIIIENDNLNLFNVDDSHSYGCNSEISTLLKNGTELEIRNAKVQAYVPQTSGTFSLVKQCKEDNKSADISNTVPIIVGASLGGLVLIVLIVFFIGRQRNRMTYTSV